MTRTSLGHKLRVLRAERGLTLRDAASRTGVAKETISDIERGIRHPHDVTVAKLAEGYGVPIGDLLEELVPAGKDKAPQKLELTASLVQLDIQPFPDVLDMDDEGLEDLRARTRDEKEGRLYAAIRRAYGAAVEEHDILLEDEGAPPEELAEAEERRRRLRKLWKVVLFERLAPRVDADPQRKPDAPVEPDTTGLSLEEAFEVWRGSRVPVGA
jgi:transcriptional regulator with XRE-family HTH domain